MHRVGFYFLVLATCIGLSRESFGQSFGVELHNTLMPAAGAMGGVSVARPQDLTSAMNANPASLTQFRGTQFAFAGGWAEPTFNMNQASNIPIIGPDPRIQPFSAKSTAPGVPVGNFGVSQDLSALGLPATFGVGFITTAGCLFRLPAGSSQQWHQRRTDCFQYAGHTRLRPDRPALGGCQSCLGDRLL